MAEGQFQMQQEDGNITIRLRPGNFQLDISEKPPTQSELMEMIGTGQINVHPDRTDINYTMVIRNAQTLAGVQPPLGVKGAWGPVCWIKLRAVLAKAPQRRGQQQLALPAPAEVPAPALGGGLLPLPALEYAAPAPEVLSQTEAAEEEAPAPERLDDDSKENTDNDTDSDTSDSSDSEKESASDDMKKENQRLQKETMAYKNKCDDLNRRVTELTLDLDATQEAFDASDAANDKLLKDNCALKRKLTELSKDVSTSESDACASGEESDV